MDPLEMEMIKPYCLYVVAFAAGIYANMRALEGEPGCPQRGPCPSARPAARRLER